MSDLNTNLAQIKEFLAAEKELFYQLSIDVWNKPELGFEEKFAAKRQIEILQEFGFKVDNPYSIETAFRAEWGEGDVVFAIASEYDALPELGHACGHNLICAAALAAARATQQMLKKYSLPGKVVVLGTPGEESIGGKVIMLKENCLDGIDAVMMLHPSWRNTMDMGCTAINRLKIEYFGKSTHAAGSPEKAINALDAAIVLFNSVGLWRQQLPESSRVHGIIEEGGQRPNIIPDYTRSYFFLRSPEDDVLEVMNKQFAEIVEGAAKITGCTFNMYPHNQPYKARKPNTTMNLRYKAAMEAQGREVQEVTAGRGSTDFGDFSQAKPGIHTYFSISPVEIPGHSKELCSAANSDYGRENMLAAAAAMAEIAFSFLKDEKFRNEVVEEFAGK